jgi:hypothetical protein
MKQVPNVGNDSDENGADPWLIPGLTIYLLMAVRLGWIPQTSVSKINRLADGSSCVSGKRPMAATMVDGVATS